jgi:hypothetical protein
MTGTVRIYTRDDLIKSVQDIGPEHMHLIDERHLRGGCTGFLEADRVELHIDGKVRILKNRYGPG